MIKILDSFVSDKIAAGEVIERPLSIVKELVENSIDAESTAITLEIRNGGKSYIRITDNGTGIAGSEVELAFERHATGKISSIVDLDNIETLGFRGEALASIAAISRVTIYTKTEQESLGAKVVMHGGRVVSNEKIGSNKGTTIIVEDTFYNTPARRKFMRSDAAETTAIIDFMERIAIFYNGISFKLLNNGETVLSTTSGSDRNETIKAIYPSNDYSDLIHIKNEILEGYISNPGITKKTRKGQLFFVNGRIIDSTVIEKGIKTGYGDRVFSGYPIAILFLSVSADTIDVNIHPNKRTVKFLNSTYIEKEVASAISDVLFTENSIPETYHIKKESIAKPEQSYSSEQQSIKTYLSDRRDNKKSPEHHTKSTFSDFEYTTNSDIIKSKFNTKNVSIASSDSNSENIEIQEPSVKPFVFEDLIVKGYVFNTYIITECNDLLYILDQHAAHERILYEKLVTEYNIAKPLSQIIISPITLEVSSMVYNADRSWINALERLGYDISDFGNNTFIIRAIPESMTAEEAYNFALSFTEDPEVFSTKNSIVIDKIIMRSCKGAVKANDKLSENEMSDLLTELSKCKNPFSCPHGRPVFVKISKYEIERSFKRK